MKPVRILMIRSTSSYGGAERQIIGYASRLDPQFFQPVICGFADDIVEGNKFLYKAAEAGLKTMLLNTSSGFDRNGIRDLIKKIRDIGFDLLCPQDYRANVYALAAGRKLGIPVVATAHGYTGHTMTVKLYEAFDRLYTLRMMDKVICVSRALMRRLKRWGVPKSKLALVHNSVDTSEIQLKFRDRPGYVTCSVGRLSVEKGHRYLLEAWRTVVDSLHETELLLVGDGPERAKLERQSAELGISSYIRFTGFTDSPMEYISQSDVFILPSIIEGLPVALLEACAAGRPIIATSVGGIGEVIISGLNGILVQPGRPAELADALLKLLQDHEQSALMGKAARRTVETRFSFEKNTSEIEKVYLPFIERKRTAQRGSYAESSSHSPYVQ